MASRLSRLCCCCCKRSQTEEDDDDGSDVRILNYSNCDLDDVPDKIFLHERTLEKLILHSNRIMELPWSIFNCRYLRVLVIRDNNINTLPEPIHLLSSLEQLDVGQNALTEIHPNLRECKKLKVLDISSNPISVLPDVVTQISSLEELYVNDIGIILLTANIGRLRNLKILELRNNKLTTLPQSCNKLVHLTKLDIGMNSISKVPLVFLELRNLQELWYDANGVFDLVNFQNFLQLKVLELECNNLSSVPDYIGACKNLVHLSLEENYITNLPSTISNLEKLQILKLRENDLTELPDELGNLCNLEELHVSYNKLKHLPSSIGLLRKLVVLHAECNHLVALPREIGSCVNLRVLSLQSNYLKEVPAEMGNLVRLSVLNLINNKLQYLPISFNKLDNLKALWLAYNQGKPLVNLQSVYNPDTHSYVVTCYLLPQLKVSRKKGNKSAANDSSLPKPRTACRIKFANESEDRRGNLTRVPTPVPTKLKRMARKFQKGEEVPTDAVRSQNREEVIQSPVLDEMPSTSSEVKTAVVRKQPGELAEDNYLKVSSSCNTSEEVKSEETETYSPVNLFSTLSSYYHPECEESTGNISETLVETTLEETVDVPCARTPVTSSSDEVEHFRNSSSSDIEIEFDGCGKEKPNFDSAELPTTVSDQSSNVGIQVEIRSSGTFPVLSDISKKYFSPGAVEDVSIVPSKCEFLSLSSDLRKGESPVYSNIGKSAWVFGMHKNALVVPVTLKVTEKGIGFSLTENDQGDIVIKQLNYDIDCSPNLQVGDKILQVDHIDIKKSDNAGTIKSFMEGYQPGCTISMVVSRLCHLKKTRSDLLKRPVTD